MEDNSSLSLLWFASSSGAVGLSPYRAFLFLSAPTTLAAKPVVATIVYSPQRQAPAGTTLCEAREWLMGAFRHFFQPFMR